MKPSDDDDERPGAAPLAVAATRPRGWFGCDKRLLIYFAGPLALTTAFSSEWLVTIASLAVTAVSIGIIRALWVFSPYLVDDFLDNISSGSYVADPYSD